MENENTGTEAQNAGEDKTSENNEKQEAQPSQADESLETLKAQKSHWRDQAVDPETGKKYKDLYLEAQKKKDKTSTKNEKKDNSPDDTLIQKTYLRAANIVEQDEVDLALETSQKWNMSVDQLVDDEDFKMKLDKLRTEKATQQATTNVKGDGSGKSSAKESPDYWKQKGAYPTREDVPDRKTRVKIAREFMNNDKGKIKFYND